MHATSIPGSRLARTIEPAMTAEEQGTPRNHLSASAPDPSVTDGSPAITFQPAPNASACPSRTPLQSAARARSKNPSTRPSTTSQPRSPATASRIQLASTGASTHQHALFGNEVSRRDKPIPDHLYFRPPNSTFCRMPVATCAAKSRRREGVPSAGLFDRAACGKRGSA